MTGRRRLHRPVRATLWAAWLVAALAAYSAAAGEPPAAVPRIVAIRAGFDGRFKVGYWTPLEIVLESGDAPASGQLQCTVLDGDGVPSRVETSPQAPIQLSPGQSTTVRLDYKIGQASGGLLVELVSEGQVLASRKATTAADSELAGVLASNRELIVAIGAPLPETDTPLFAERQATVARVADARRLPEHWYGYEGVDWVFLATGDEASAAALMAEPARLEALDHWVRLGGKLLVSVGREARQVLAADSPLARFAPGTFEAPVPLRQSTILEAYAGSSEPMVPADGGPLALEIPKLAGVQGKIEAYAGAHARDLPLVVRTAHDFGEIVFVAFDLDRSPLVEWVARPQFFDKLTRRKAGEAVADSTTLGHVTTLGFTDLAGQLRGALDQFEGVTLAPFWLVAVLTVTYIVCIGPLDYLLVKKLLGRMEATWITFGVTALAFSAGAYALAYALKGNEIRVNQLDVIDFSAETQLVRGTSWANLFSPETALYDLALRPRPLDGSPSAERVLLSWMGLPGKGFGGIDPEQKFGGVEGGAAGMSLFTEPYGFAPALDRLWRVPVSVWSSKAFVARWQQQAAPGVEARLADRGKLTGTLTSNLDAPLEDTVLLYDRWAYPIRQLKPGQTLDVETALDPQTVDTYLRHVTVQGDRNIAVPYEPRSFDVPRTIEIMSAFELAGGEKYTALANAYQGFVDLSGAVRNGRAVLIGRRAVAGAQLERDGAPLASQADGPGSRHWTIYRFVFPVNEPATP